MVYHIFFNSTITFFPDGWSFPGRANSFLANATYNIPITIINNGYYSYPNNTLISYKDQWDFFLFVENKPDVLDAGLMDPTVFGCPLNVNTSSAGLSKDLKIFIGILITIVVLGILGWLYFVTCRRSGSTSVRQHTRHVELKEINRQEPDEEAEATLGASATDRGDTTERDTNDANDANDATDAPEEKIMTQN